MQFQLQSPYQPTGDQPQAIAALSAGVQADKKYQTLLGVTGSGKTFTMANVIQETQLPTLVIAHNKTLAAQLYQEFRDFFPDNAVSYFVSYYDYYQPEAYIPTTDTYIEKEATINDEIDKLRLATTTNLMTRRDCIVVASVSCIYNLGSPVEYGNYFVELVEGEVIARDTLLEGLSQLQYERSTAELRRGTYRLRGDILQIWPAYEDKALSIDTLENKITSINWINPLNGSIVVHADEASEGRRKKFVIYPAKHYLIDPQQQTNALAEIRQDLNQRLAVLKQAGKVLEAYRLQQKVQYDLEMIQEFGFVNGIENYSRYFDGRQPGEAPFTLLDHFQENARKFAGGKFLTVIDESHMTLPQIKGMYNGDQARKDTLVEYGFRLPSAKDNRPLRYEEFMARNKQMVFVSATPNEKEISLSQEKVVEQLIRPTGLVDPEVELRRTQGQIEDLILEVIKRKAVGQRVLVTTLTKRMAETLTEYLNDEEKMKELIALSSRAESRDLNPEKIIRANEQLNPDELAIGPIPDQLYTHCHPELVSGSFDKLLPKVAYLHSDIQTLERSDILDDLRRGEYDVLVGINLLREGLDLPEVSLVAILDADKEGFLRSSTALIQTMGRAARHEAGRVLLYADNMTGSMKAAITETARRRAKQLAYNQTHHITVTSISKPIRERMLERTETTTESGPLGKSKQNRKGEAQGFIVQLSKKEYLDLHKIDSESLTPAERKILIGKLERRMKQAANMMDYELAALLRDTIETLQN